ncbi:MAG: hypothetical protein LWW98_08380 [Deltaproteobacteria bacterium]|nr:hypothetical protein [Deltaproteobacteria bacterium]
MRYFNTSGQCNPKEHYTVMRKENENHSAEKKCSRWAIRPLVPEEVYTNRKEHIDYLYNAAIKAITRRTMSTVLLGKRRMGKTEIFKRVVNRLFFEQENYHDLNQSVVPDILQLQGYSS